MDQLIKLVMAKTGLSESMATMAVDVVLGFIKEKLPRSVADQIWTLLGLDAADSKTGKAGKDDGIGVDDVLKGLGGMLGGQK